MARCTGTSCRSTAACSTGCGRPGRCGSIGIDSWAVDYGLLDATGALLGNPVHYRDARTDGMPAGVAKPCRRRPALRAHRAAAAAVQHALPARRGGRHARSSQAARHLLLIPDLLAYWLTGEIGAEITNASTTQLLDVRTGDWALPLLAELGLRSDILPPLRAPGSRDRAGAAGHPADHPGRRRGRLARHRLGRGRRAGRGRRTSPTSPAAPGRWSAWSSTRPVLTEASRLANFTNEGGVDGTIRYLRNVMGLWPLQESMRELGADRRGRAAAGRRRASRPSPPSSTSTTRCSCRRATCRRGSPTPAARPGSRFRPARRPSPGASWTASRSHTGVRSARPRSCPAGTSTRCTSSAAARATSCSASSPRTPAGCRCWPARWRRPRWATCWSRPGPRVRSAATWRRCAALLRETQQIVGYEPRGDEAAWRAAEQRAGG